MGCHGLPSYTARLVKIARALNFGEGFQQRELNKALKEITEMRNALMASLGREVV